MGGLQRWLEALQSALTPAEAPPGHRGRTAPKLCEGFPAPQKAFFMLMAFQGSLCTQAPNSQPA